MATYNTESERVVKMTAQQIQWAAQHDWFIEARNGKVLVRDETARYCSRFFHDFNDLKQWAGY